MVSTVKLISSDGQIFEFKPSFVRKADMLKQMLSDLGFDEEGIYPKDGIPLPSIPAEPLGTILKWLQMHENDAPRTQEQRQRERFNDNRVTKVDKAFLDMITTRTKLAAVINAAYYLEMPDLTETLVKYTASNLNGKKRDDMAAWFEFEEGKKKKAEDDEEGPSPKKRVKN